MSPTSMIPAPLYQLTIWRHKDLSIPHEGEAGLAHRWVSVVDRDHHSSPQGSPSRTA